MNQSLLSVSYKLKNVQRYISSSRPMGSWVESYSHAVLVTIPSDLGK